MRYILCFIVVLSISCKPDSKKERSAISRVETSRIFEDSTSIRAIEVTDDAVAFAGSNGVYGYYKLNDEADSTYPQVIEKNAGTIDFLGNTPAFRAIASTSSHIFLLSIVQPALLYSYDKTTRSTELVYLEDVEGVFYDAMTFWNNQEGIAMGDPVDGCISVIITRDGGASWSKLACDKLPKTADGEAAFAASDTNISVQGTNTWIITGGKKSNVLYSPDKGRTWTLYKTPLVQGAETTGGYSIDFYDDKTGVIYGGDYLKPQENSANIAISQDGGKQWQLLGQNVNQGYKSCVQFVPNSNGMELVALGFSGISYSQDGGAHWKEISKEAYLSFRFLNDSIAFASGKNKVDKLVFKRD
jgi:photosystem II stability/assembly factor-like uncharacterized protein